jgi:hypothetical protein
VCSRTFAFRHSGEAAFRVWCIVRIFRYLDRHPLSLYSCPRLTLDETLGYRKRTDACARRCWTLSIPLTHAMTEADTCRKFVVPAFVTEDEVDEYSQIRKTDILTAESAENRLQEMLYAA